MAEDETYLNTIRKLPNPDGRLGNFDLEEYTMMSLAFAP